MGLMYAVQLGILDTCSTTFFLMKIQKSVHLLFIIYKNNIKQRRKGFQSM